MFNSLLILHNIFRWLVLLTLVASIIRAAYAYAHQRPFTDADNALRHWTATAAHIQLVFGMLTYIQSPVVKYYFQTGDHGSGAFFFGVLHIALMLVAIILLTIGSSLAKRRKEAAAKFATMLLWYSISLLIILIAIPWPFSPLAARPLLRSF